MAIKLYTQEELLDRHIGPMGTPQRDEFERKLSDEIQAYRLGEAVRKARTQQKLTQEELGERTGVGRAQISKIEKGHNSSLSSISRVFRALGVPTASLDLGNAGKVALW